MPPTYANILGDEHLYTQRQCLPPLSDKWHAAKFGSASSYSLTRLLAYFLSEMCVCFSYSRFWKCHRMNGSVQDTYMNEQTGCCGFWKLHGEKNHYRRQQEGWTLQNPTLSDGIHLSKVNKYFMLNYNAVKNVDFGVMGSSKILLVQCKRHTSMNWDIT